MNDVKKVAGNPILVIEGAPAEVSEVSGITCQDFITGAI